MKLTKHFCIKWAASQQFKKILIAFDLRHFSLDEFTRSATAQANGVDNTLDMTKPEDRIVVENLEHLCQTVLEPLREQMGMTVVISSGYRCRELNSLVGGARNSQHLVGEAADIQPPYPSVPPRVNEALKRWFLFIQQHCRFDQLILESKGNRRWIHVSCCRDESKNRQSCMTKRSAEVVTPPCLQRDSTVPPPFGRESVDNRWTIGRGSSEAKPPLN